MPANEFEKQVQQKMNEWGLAPADGVWLEVERRIRPEKKRRIIFWISFLFLGLGLAAGTFIFIKNRQHNPYAKEQPLKTSPDKIESKPVRPAGIPVSESKQNQIKNDLHKPEEKSTVMMPFPGKKKSIIIPANKVIDQNPLNPVVVKGTENDPATAKTDPVSPKAESTMITGKEDVQDKVKNIKKPELNIITDVKPVADAHGNDSIVMNNTKALHDDLPATITKSDTVLAIKKKKESKWEKYFTAEAGWSGYNNGLLNGNYNDANTYLSSTSSPGPGFYVPQNISNGFSFSAGVGLKKRVSKDLQLVFGLQYHYYSNHTKTGAWVAKDSTVRYSSDQVSISGYYRNGTENNYTNQFHVLELPFTLEYQPFRAAPVSFSFGISYGYRFRTNALVFDRNANIYYENEKAFVKHYINIISSVQYNWLKKGRVSIETGPVLVIGCNQVQKSIYMAIPHLYFFGIKNTIGF